MSNIYMKLPDDYNFKQSRAYRTEVEADFEGIKKASGNQIDGQYEIGKSKDDYEKQYIMSFKNKLTNLGADIGWKYKYRGRLHYALHFFINITQSQFSYPAKNKMVPGGTEGIR